MAALKWAAVALGGAPFAVSVYALRAASEWTQKSRQNVGQ